MTNEQMRVKIAESLGKFARKTGEIVEYQDWRGDFMFQRVRFPNGSISPCHVENVPNYPEDLNACAEFEKNLNHKNLEFHTYTCYVLQFCTEEGNHTYCATALQRCRAYLKTKALHK